MNCFPVDSEGSGRQDRPIPASGCIPVLNPPGRVIQHSYTIGSIADNVAFYAARELCAGQFSTSVNILNARHNSGRMIHSLPEGAKVSGSVVEMKLVYINHPPPEVVDGRLVPEGQPARTINRGEPRRYTALCMALFSPLIKFYCRESLI